MSEKVQNLLDAGMNGPNPLYRRAIFGYMKKGKEPVYHVSDGVDVRKQFMSPIRENSIFDIASITKILLTVLCHILRQDGKFRYDTSIASVLELEGEYMRHLKISHLLQFYARFVGGHPTKDVIGAEGGGMKLLLNEICQKGLISEPGTDWKYSNVHSILLGVCLERLFNCTLDHLMSERLLIPLGMSCTTPRPQFALNRVVQSQQDVVIGMINDPTANLALQEGRVIGSAGYFSTASDMLKLLSMIMNGGAYEGKQIIPESTVNCLHEGMSPKFGNGFGLWDNFRKNLKPDPVSDPFGIFKSGHTGCIVYVLPSFETLGVILTDLLMIDRTKEMLEKARSESYSHFAHLATLSVET